MAAAAHRIISIILLTTLGLFLTPPAMAVHPQDGPHADMRVTITDESVSFNITMNLVFVDELVGVFREDFYNIHPIEEPDLEMALEAHFKEKNIVAIDGIEVTPVLRDFQLDRGGADLLALFPRTGMRGVLRIHVIVDYPAKSPPQSVRFVWNGYPDDVLSGPPEDPPPLVIGILLTAEGQTQNIEFREEEPEYTWHATGKTIDDLFLPIPEAAPEPEKITLPVVSIGLIVGFISLSVFLLGVTPAGGLRRALIGCAFLGCVIGVPFTWSIAPYAMTNPFAPQQSLPTDDEALEIFRPLHANIYRAFDYTSEEEIYQALSRSVTGEILDGLYNEIYRSLIMQEEGGAVSRVQSVTPIATEVVSIGTLPERGDVSFTVRNRWQVEGYVYHWGHSHTRLNEYLAEYTVIEDEAGWRIAGSRSLEQFRVDAAPVDNAEVPRIDL